MNENKVEELEKENARLKERIKDLENSPTREVVRREVVREGYNPRYYGGVPEKDMDKAYPD